MLTRTSPAGSLGSSGHSSPTGGGPPDPGGAAAAAGGLPPGHPPGPGPGHASAAAVAAAAAAGYHPNYRNALPYLPGSVHHTGYGGAGKYSDRYSAVWEVAWMVFSFKIC